MNHVLLPFDNARPQPEPVHKAAFCIFLPHHPYNPDLAPSKLHLLGRLTYVLRGSGFEDDDELKNGTGDSAKS